jgi:hypothetical protein
MVDDGQSFIEVKKARIARSGKQSYLASEMRGRGNFKDLGKAVYTEYRPSEVLLKHKDKFANVAFVNDHSPEDVTPDNWRTYMVGAVGSSIGVEVVNDDVWLTADIVFYDKSAYEDYKSGKRELSARYDALYRWAEDAERQGYDTVLVDIPAVNHVALCDRARAGHEARILDSAPVFNMHVGGVAMEKTKLRSGFLQTVFGIGKPKDDGFKFSTVLMDSVAKVGTLDAAGLEKEVGVVMSHITVLGDSEPKELLVGAVSDCFKHPVEVLVQKDAVSAKLDELYGKCRNADAETVKRIIGDSEKGSDKSKKEDGEKDAGKKKEGEDEGAGKTSDSAAPDFARVVDDAVKAAFSKMDEGITAKIDAAVKKALGVDDAADKSVKPAASAAGLDDSVGGGDGLYLVRGVFGTK